MSNSGRERASLTGGDNKEGQSASQFNLEGAPATETPEQEGLRTESQETVRSQMGTDRNPRGRLKDDDIESKTGNYILSFGYAGSGKTTFQSFLAYYVNHSPKFRSRLRLDPDQSQQGWDPQVIYNDWLKSWTEGRFPESTGVLEEHIGELSFQVNPKKGVKTPLEFSFLEVSGELVRRVIAEREADPNLVETLRLYLANDKLNVILTLVVDPENDTKRENDLLFQNLFNYLEVNFPELIQRASLAILISKPEIALKNLKYERPSARHYADFRGEVCEEYVEVFLPATYNQFDDWPNSEKASIMALHLGDFEGVGRDAVMRKFDFRDISQIFSWMYTQFTAEKLGLKWWQKALNWIRE